MKYTLMAVSALLGLASCGSGSNPEAGEDFLRFDPQAFRIDSLAMPSGEVVKFKAYEGIYYVRHIEDSAYQQLNIYVPADTKNRADKDIPILMRNNVGGYMASPAGTPSAVDATGRALAEGYVVCIPGARGNGSTIT